LLRRKGPGIVVHGGSPEGGRKRSARKRETGMRMMERSCAARRLKLCRCD